MAPSPVTPPTRRGPDRRGFLPSGLAFCALIAVGGCDRRLPPPLQPDDLRRDERTYVSRVLVLERVKARLIVDFEAGTALGDSLAAAWGDSALPRTIDLAPVEPERAERVQALLLRLLAAEHDSLLRHEGRRPLDAPWPVPADSVPLTPGPASARVRTDG